jgi:hypothetical protein
MSADILIGIVHGALVCMWHEAQQASENKDALISLAQSAQDVIRPQLKAIRDKLSESNEEHIRTALAQLHQALDSITELIKKRGRKRSKGWLPLDAITCRAAKVQAEIEGARSNLSQAMKLVVMSLQIQTLAMVEGLAQKITDAVTDGVAQKLNDALRVSEDSADFNSPEQYPWAIQFSELTYERTPWGKPIKTIELGTGGFGTVFRATYCNAEVAVKMPHSTSMFTKDPKARKAFFREANNLYRMHHRNVVSFVGAIASDESDEPCYMLVTERLAETLEAYVMSPVLKEAGKKHEIILGMAEGLAYLHSMKIIHRDIKPQNVMLSAAGVPKFIDFGLSKEKEDFLASQSSTQLAGTDAWMSPERKNSQPSSPASDVYSFGLVILFVLAEKYPASCPAERVRDVQQVRGSDLCVTLALCCMREDPAGRPTSATVATSLLIKMYIFSDPAVHTVSAIITSHV